ncbi:TPA: type VI secretion lipoprotein TssJ [Escherichia coli]|uniref:type VI secretion lipoprotein TssJ n=1 Tax=Escherichia coli TaxID=562 RepID=UPI00096A9176|nr:type VI secretion lipoprotein TssJ [Escherichia coli]HDQ6732128.1 type VI secretion lipoprotein TssJ [Escherichia coli O11:H5]EEW0912170.1 type VI secretion lipoprotein TssJ [Escherichia coli]EFI6793440.1 type VI secretion lipoprotein TssJ [Escherichia coli]EFJ0227497.1 type VI secretion lipoprotein TssJ [Escherichia coli]MDM4038319.1 type VI secretion lipoprotein TssJ [Escherichia coli]
MTSKYLLLIAIALPFFISSCSDKYSEQDKMQVINNVDTPFGAGLITFQISPDTQLNSLNDISNSCTLLFLQASGKKTLQDLMNNPVLIKQFFSGAGKIDGILKVDKYVAMPGQETTLHIDRSEGAKYVGIIAGYYPFPGKQHMVLLDIPVNVIEDGWWNKSLHASLSPLFKKISMGKESISIK